MAAHTRQDMPPPVRRFAASHIQFTTPQRQPSDANPSSDLTTSSSKKRRRKRKSHRRSSLSSSTGTSITRTTSNTSAAIQDHNSAIYKEESPVPPPRVPPPSSIEEQQIYDKEPEHFGTYDVSDDDTYEAPAVLHTKADTPPATFSTNVFGDDTSSSDNDEPAPELNGEVDIGEAPKQEETSASDSEDSSNDMNGDVERNHVPEPSEHIADLSDASMASSPRREHSVDHIADTAEVQRGLKNERPSLREPKAGVLKRKRQSIQEPRSTKKRARTRTRLSLTPDSVSEATQPPQPEFVRVPRSTKKASRKKAKLSSNLDSAKEATRSPEPVAVPTKSKLARKRKTNSPEPVLTAHGSKAKLNGVSHKNPEVAVKVPQRSSTTAMSGSGSGSKSSDVHKAAKQTSIIDSSRSASKKTIQSTYTSAKGKDRAEDGVEYSSPQKGKKRRETVSADSSEQDDESDGLATTVARRTVQATEDSSESYEDEHGEASAGSSPKSNPKQKKNAYSLMRSASKEQAKSRARASAGDTRGEAYSGGLTGKFTDDERQVLYAWRDQFCNEHSVSRSKFNDIMTQTMRRKKTDLWPYAHIVSRTEIMAEYYDQLPDRNRRSMNRFREREFQNVVDGKWSEEDDQELSRLVGLHGSKWVEIAQEMERTQDSVHQRWRNKVQFTKKMKEGEWTNVEVQQLQDAVAQWLERNRNGSKSGGAKIAWSAIAKTVGGTRTAQQCSNKWRNLTMHREEGIYIETPLSDRIAGTATETRTPSKMHQRLTGQMSSVKPLPGKRKNFMSSERIVDSDADEDGVDEEENEREDVSEDEDGNLSPRRDEPDGRSEAVDESEVDEDDKDERSGQYDGIEIEESSGTKDASANSPGPSSFTGSQHRPLSVRSPQPVSSQNRSTQVAGLSSPPARQTNPFVAETPVQGLSMTQLHQGTQANTTAKRTTKRKDLDTAIDQSTSQDRMPSPELPLRQQPISSPLRMLGDERAHESNHASDEEDNDLSLHTASPGNAVAVEDESETESSSESSSGSGETDPESDGETASESDESEEEEEDKTEQRRKGFLSSLSMSWPWSSQRNTMSSQQNAKRDGLEEDDEAD